MMLHLKVGTKYTVQPIRMICGYNGKGCFSLSLTNMPPPPKLDLPSKPIIKTALTNIQAIQGRPGRLSMNLLHVNLGKQR